MVGPSITCVVAFDPMGVRFYSFVEDKPQLRPVFLPSQRRINHAWNAGARQGPGNTGSKRTGASRGENRNGAFLRLAAEPPSEPIEQAARQINYAVAEGLFDRLVLVAPAQDLDRIRPCLSPSVKGLLAGEITLSTLSADEKTLVQHVCMVLNL